MILWFFWTKKFPARELKKYKTKTCLMIFYHLYFERGFSGGFQVKVYENYSGRFPEGVQQEEIQQWRQAWSRPGKKETLNIMLRENRKGFKSIEINLK